MKTGIFIKEEKDRFLCKVKIDNKEEECYLSSSSHLQNLISLENKKVLLKRNKGRHLRTKYTVQALWENNSKFLLNLNYINNIVQKYLIKTYKNKTVKREYKIGTYKSDFYIEDENLIIEAKGLLSNGTVILPFKSGERCIRQLKEIKELLEKGYTVQYYMVLLNPNINQIIIEKNAKEYSVIFNKCLSLGMKIKYFSAFWKDEDCILREACCEPLLLFK